MDGEARTQVELPRYQCHKIVRAAKIKMVEIVTENYRTTSAIITPDDGAYAPFVVPAGWLERFHGHTSFDDDGRQDAGYYVVYDGGYASWSPTKAFEEGYTLIA